MNAQGLDATGKEDQMEKMKGVAASPLQHGVMCDCLARMAGYYPDSFGNHHHKNCDRYKTEKFPYLFYYEDAVDSWVPMPDKLENFMLAEDQPDIEEIEVRFKRVDMTDEEFDALPEG
jgi:hypothetical protein